MDNSHRYLCRNLACALVLLACVTTSGCASLSPVQKRALTIGAAVIAVGAIAAHRGGTGSESGHVTTPSVNCSANPVICQ